jgi:hypothetical protein
MATLLDNPPFINQEYGIRAAHAGESVGYDNNRGLREGCPHRGQNMILKLAIKSRCRFIKE